MAQVQPRFSLAVIDACRDNPFKSTGRSIGGSRGLAPPMSNAQGVMVVYAAGANQQALDRLSAQDTDPNGLFTREFIKAMRKPGLNVQEVINEVKLSVIRQASSVHHVQTPAILRSIGWDVRVLGGSWSGQAVSAVPETPLSEPPGRANAPPVAAARRRLGASPAARRCRRHHGSAELGRASVLRSLSAASLPAASIEEALRQRSGDGKSSVARRFFENSIRSSEAIAWFDSALAAGVDPNMTVPSDYYGQEGVLLEACGRETSPRPRPCCAEARVRMPTKSLLDASSQPRFLFPLRFIAEDDRITSNEKQDLAKAYLDAGAVIPKPLPPAGGSGWDSTMLEVNNLQRRSRPSLGIN